MPVGRTSRYDTHHGERGLQWSLANSDPRNEADLRAIPSKVMYEYVHGQFTSANDTEDDYIHPSKVARYLLAVLCYAGRHSERC